MPRNNAWPCGGRTRSTRASSAGSTRARTWATNCPTLCTDERLGDSSRPAEEHRERAARKHEEDDEREQVHDEVALPADKVEHAVRDREGDRDEYVGDRPRRRNDRHPVPA